MPTNDYRDYLMHHGILGQKWGVRRYQNPDGSLTNAGKRHSAKKEYKAAKKAYNKNVRKTNSEISKLEGRWNIAKSVENRDAIVSKRNNLKKEYFDLIDKKAAYKSAGKKSEKAVDRAERNVYAKAMGSMRDSINDVYGDRKATAVYNHIATKKGKDYADKIEKRIGYTSLVKAGAGVAVSVGAYAASQILMHKYAEKLG